MHRRSGARNPRILSGCGAGGVFQPGVALAGARLTPGYHSVTPPGCGGGTFSSTLQPTAQLICGMHQSRRLVKHVVHKPKPELEKDLFRIQMFGMMAGSQGPEL